MENISIKKAAIINFISRYSNILIQILINSVLARLLTPDDYGVVAVITVFISFFTIIADMGIGPAIIQDKTLTKKEISDIFIFTVFTAIAISIGFIIFSYPLSIFYENKIYITLGFILSIAIFFNVLNIVPNAILLRKKQFKTLGIRNVLITVVAGIFTIILALNGAKYYALVINSIIIAILTFAFNVYFSEIKIILSFSFESIKKIRDFSLYQFGYNFINYFARNLDNLLIGKVIDKVSLGYYDKAYKLMLYPVQNLSHMINPVLHPILSDYQDNLDKIYTQYKKILKILSLVGIFFAFYCFISAQEIIIIMFGDQWLKSVDSFKILSLSIWPQIIVGTSGVIFQSTGKTKLLFKQGLISTTLIIVCILCGVFTKKIEFVSLGIVIASYTNFIIVFYLLINKALDKNIFRFLKVFKSSLIIVIIITISYMLLYDVIAKVDMIFMSAVCKLLLTIIAYMIGLGITKEFKVFRSLLSRKK